MPFSRSQPAGKATPAWKNTQTLRIQKVLLLVQPCAVESVSSADPYAYSKTLMAIMATHGSTTMSVRRVSEDVPVALADAVHASRLSVTSVKSAGGMAVVVMSTPRREVLASPLSRSPYARWAAKCLLGRVHGVLRRESGSTEAGGLRR